MNKKKTYTQKTKLAELIEENQKLLLLLPRFGIHLGFGEHSVEEVCKAEGISWELFLAVCQIYTENQAPHHDFENTTFDSLLPYLLASHRYYLDERIPHIEEHLQHIIDAAGAKYGKLLARFYSQYKEDVVKHFDYEEQVVFPYIKALRNGNPPSDYNIDQFRHNHSNIEDSLDDMINILLKYLPGDILPKERIEISIDIKDLFDDLYCHSLVEDHILIPYVESLENARP